jgi:hypothetical protein
MMSSRGKDAKSGGFGQQREVRMKRLIGRLLLGAAVTAALAIPGGAAIAKNESSCTFQQGTTTCTTVHGSDGSTDTHHGNVDSSGVGTGGGSCKVTGPEHTC